jgi:uncharacterized protein
MITSDLIKAILDQYQLPIFGVHGISHWARVYENGMRVAQETGASIPVVQLFAVFHDSRRQNEAIDPGHGGRGAELAKEFRGLHYELPDDDFDLLIKACVKHTDGLREGDITLQTCWDADRLDLARVRIMPEPRFLCTLYAQGEDVISWANERSQARTIPEFVNQEWLVGIDLAEGE